MVTPTHTYEYVTAEEFPHGLRCSFCNRIIDLGFPYKEFMVGFSFEGGEEVYELTCVYCPEEGELF